MKITITDLTLTNFKGVKLAAAHLGGSDATISGANGTGKTTVMDAWLWLLFDRDSAGHKGADACKTTTGASFAHNLTHSVAAEITVGFVKYHLRKELSENWVKKRGQQDAEMDGNNNNFWIDDVPMKKKDYDAKIAELAPQELFLILTDPLYFSTELPYKERFRLLKDLCGGITNREIAGDDEGLNTLLDHSGNKPIEDAKKMLLEQIRMLNADIVAIQPRIDEQSRNLVSAVDFTLVEAQIQTLKEALMIIEHDESNAKAAMRPMLEAQDKLLRLKRDRDNASRELRFSTGKNKTDALSALSDASGKVAALSQMIRSIASDIQGYDVSIARLEQSLGVLRGDLADAKAKKAELSSGEFHGETAVFDRVCPTCKQSLPADMLDGKIEDMRFDYDSRKAVSLVAIGNRIDQIIAVGNTTKSSWEHDVSIRASAKVALTEMQQSLVVANETLSTLTAAAEKAIADHDKSALNPINTPELDQQIAELEAYLSAPVEDRASELAAKKREIRQTIDSLTLKLEAREYAKRAQVRIDELRALLREHSDNKSALEGYLYQIGRFAMATTAKLEGKINALFSKVGFKLFSEQINGGITETCEAIVGQTTFGKANTAAQVNAGLDIIRAIGAYTDTSVPVFVDRLESINDLIQIPAQTIKLLVTRDDALTVTREE
jgi:DNA repair exonuclease SbcCD ATPase subunit